MPRRTLLSAATHAWRATDHLHLLGAQRDDPAPDSPLAQFREALGTALERARTVDGSTRSATWSAPPSDWFKCASANAISF